MSLRFLEFCLSEWVISSFGAEDANYEFQILRFTWACTDYLFDNKHDEDDSFFFLLVYSFS